MKPASGLAHALLSYREPIADEVSRGADFLVGPGDESPRDRISGELYFVARHLEECPEFGDFLLGEKARALRALNPSGDAARSAQLLLGERSAVLAAARSHLATAEVTLLESTLEELFRPLVARPTTRMRVLFIGDCLGREIQGFLYPACRKRGIELDLVHLGGKTEFLIRQAVRGYQHDEYDIVFYSPVTHESIPEFSRITTRPWASRRALHRAAHSAMAQAIATAEWLREYFPAPPIFVHNTALLLSDVGDELGVPASDGVKQWLKRMLTSPARRAASATFNTLLDEYIASQPAERRFHLLDERRLVATLGEDNVRGALYDVADIHPTRFGQHLSTLYASIVAASGLRSKKVFVTDLDNTLWEGLVGEGAVRHLRQRQRTLKALREKGYLLAVSSKNDRDNVRWDDTVLAENDFVAFRVNWEPKGGNIRSIASELNLKLSDFAFIDDSPTERALVQQAIPEMTVLDATDARVWETLEFLGRMTPSHDEMDRTKLYLERKKRAEYLEPAADEPERHRAALAALGLSARIARAEPRNVARITELVNRTNQFNITGLRITETLLRDRIDDPLRPVFCADVSDRFGDSGLVAAALVRLGESDVEIEAFVLSCRVFGFGVETALMNAIKRVALAAQRSRVVARLVETQHNRPCHTFLSDHGFQGGAGYWYCGDFVELHDPDWLEVTVPAEMLDRSVQHAVASPGVAHVST